MGGGKVLCSSRSNNSSNRIVLIILSRLCYKIFKHLVSEHGKYIIFTQWFPQTIADCHSGGADSIDGGVIQPFLNH